MAKPLGGSRLAVALTVAVAAALVLGTVYICLVAVGEPMLPRPLNVLLFLAVFTTIVTLAVAWQGSRTREELASLRREQDERDGRIYAALARRSTEITAEIPRPRVVATVPAVVLSSPGVVEMPSPSTVEAMRRLARRVTES